MPHKGEVPVIHITDFSGIFEFQHALNREHNIDVPVGIRVVVIVVGYVKICGRGICRNFSECRIPFRVVHIKGMLGPEMNAAGGNQ